MNELQFNRLKEELYSIISLRIEELKNDSEKIKELEMVLRILDQYTFHNKLIAKGKLTHTILDSLSIDNDISEKLISFDMYL